MTGHSLELIHSFRVGSRSVVISLPTPKSDTEMASATLQWRPDKPKSVSHAEWVQYQTGRIDALAEFARYMGRTIAVIEVEQ